jgi:hypothetical protein
MNVETMEVLIERLGAVEDQVRRRLERLEEGCPVLQNVTRQLMFITFLYRMLHP